jgi:hypothetical protein
MFILAKGTSRYVIAIPALGIVLKLARIRFDALESIGRAYCYHRQDKKPIGEFIERLYRLRYKFLEQSWIGWTRGMADNLRERSYYKHGCFPFRLLLQPTYLSLLGLINVQRYGTPIGSAESELGILFYHQVYGIARQSLILDGHHWSNAANFHIHNGALKVLDYGGEQTQKILDTYGFELFRRFDSTGLS